MSMTIWRRKSEFCHTISHLTQKPIGLTTELLHSLTLGAENSTALAHETIAVIPPLIDSGSISFLFPMSSIFTNPFSAVRLLNRHIPSPDPQHIMGLKREARMRDELYLLFSGERFEIVTHPVDLKHNGATTTDIDAAILDRETGSIAIFQLKWQDFMTGNPKRLRSMAKNFVEQVDTWANKIEHWISAYGVDKLRQSLQLPSGSSTSPSDVKLFGIGRMAARFQSYGQSQRNTSVATCSWLQFVRNRIEVGPEPCVFSEIHKRIQSETSRQLNLTTRPYEFRLRGQRVILEDFWVQIENSAKS